MLVLILCLLLAERGSGKTETPIIGVLSQETFIISDSFSEKYDSFIAASYVKFLESAGARVVPIWIGQKEDYYERVVNYTNGLFFPGGGTYFNETGGYGEAATYLYKYAVDLNKNGTYYPVWGTCLGLQVIMYASLNGTKDIRVDCYLKDVSTPLNFVDGYKDSRLFSNASEDILSILSNQNVTYNFHRYCITEKSLEDNNIRDNWHILSVNKDANGLEFISSLEHKTYPVYGVQFHPEKSQFEFSKGKKFPHGFGAVKIGQYFANVFVNESRENGNGFPDDDLEAKSLIYNFNPQYSGLNNSSYEQIYTFLKTDFEKFQLN